MTLEQLKQFIVSDSQAITFQTLGQYRSELLRQIHELEKVTTTACDASRSEFERVALANQWDLARQLDGSYYSIVTKAGWVSWQALMARIARDVTRKAEAVHMSLNGGCGC